MHQDYSTDNSASAKSMFVKANDFLKALLPLSTFRDLTPGKEYALFPFTHGNRETFDYYAPSTTFFRGLPLLMMGPTILEAAVELLKASLSDEGFKRFERLRLLENVLTHREASTPKNPRFIVRNSGLYYVSLFGTLSPGGELDPDKPWSWRIEGHHLSLHWTVVNGKIISSTPQFIGSQPAMVREDDIEQAGLPTGTRPLGPEEDLARDLIASLDDTQQQKARSEVPWDIETTNVSDALTQRLPNRIEDSGNGIRGILYSDLTSDQQKKLKVIVEQHTSLQLPVVAQERISRIEKSGWERVRFFLMGGRQEGDALYYKIRSDTFLIEYLNKAFTPSNGTVDHQHTVWRDFYNDWGLDCLHKILEN